MILSEGNYRAQREKGRPRRKRKTLRKGGKTQREATGDPRGRIITKRGGRGISMEEEDQSGWFGRKCYILKNLKAEIEKQNQQKKEKLLQMEGVT